MTAILSFFVEDGDKLIVVADRQVTHDWGIIAKDKFSQKGIFYIFCSGFEDIYNQLLSEISNNRTNTGHLANFINDKNNRIIEEERRRAGIHGDSCSYFLVNSTNLDIRKIIRGTVNSADNFDIIGAGEDYKQEVYGIFTRYSIAGTQVINLDWNDVLQQKIIKAFQYMASKTPIIGHPALFGLDLFVFQIGQTQRFTIRFPTDVRDPNKYEVTPV